MPFPPVSRLERKNRILISLKSCNNKKLDDLVAFISFKHNISDKITKEYLKMLYKFGFFKVTDDKVVVNIDKINQNVVPFNHSK